MDPTIHSHPAFKNNSESSFILALREQRLLRAKDEDVYDPRPPLHPHPPAFPGTVLIPSAGPLCWAPKCLFCLPLSSSPAFVSPLPQGYLIIPGSSLSLFQKSTNQHWLILQLAWVSNYFTCHLSTLEKRDLSTQQKRCFGAWGWNLTSRLHSVCPWASCLKSLDLNFSWLYNVDINTYFRIVVLFKW